MKNERYTCDRCGYKTDLKGSFKRHIFKAILCKNKDKEVDIEEIRKCFLSSSKKSVDFADFNKIKEIKEASEMSEKSEKIEKSEKSEKIEKKSEKVQSHANPISQMLESAEFQSKVGDNLLERIRQMPESDVLKINCHVGEKSIVVERRESMKERYISIVVETLDKEENFVTEEYLRWIEKIPLTSHKHLYQAWIKTKPKNVRMPKTITIEESF
jgi:hypothetical protein